MSIAPQRPTLSVGNHIYLYRLLSNAIGCGKQTLTPKVEEALAAERMTAEDLGFTDTRELLEALDDFIELTVFKGGRIYATVIAQPAWDEALAAPEKVAAKSGSAKSWKRKKADKSLKPVQPRRVKRPKAEPETHEEDPAPQAENIAATLPVQPDPAAESNDDATLAPEATGSHDLAETAPNASEAHENATDTETQQGNELAIERQDEVSSPTGDITVEEEDSAQPAISLTVIYDPEHANAGITTLESTPGISPTDLSGDAEEPVDVDVTPNEPAIEPDTPSVSEAEETTAPAVEAILPFVNVTVPVNTEPAQTDARASETAAGPAMSEPLPTDPEPAQKAEPELPEDYPHDLTINAYCPGAILSEISYLLPYGADVMGILNEYYHIALLRGTLEIGRNRATFPFGYAQDGVRRWATVRIKRNTAPNGAPWLIDSIVE